MRTNDYPTLVFGYSPNEERYSNKAALLLNEFHHPVVTFNLRENKIEDLSKLVIENAIHTVTMYVNPELSQKYFANLIALPVKRFIFNPGTENEALIQGLQENKKEVVIGCTLVMLKTDQF